jgi:hypothetical protein
MIPLPPAPIPVGGVSPDALVHFHRDPWAGLAAKLDPEPLRQEFLHPVLRS